MTQRRVHLALVGAWLLALCAGWCWMVRYQYATQPAGQQIAASAWPSDSTLARPNAFTLLLFLHPRCPCSRASIIELERLLENLRSQHVALPAIYVVATVPENWSVEWTQTETLSRAAKLEGSQVVIDPSGQEALRFGAQASGTLILFDARGSRLYAGGITPSRGAEGENAGRLAIETLLEGKSYSGTPMPVFGCRLCLPADRACVSDYLTDATKTAPAARLAPTSP